MSENFTLFGGAAPGFIALKQDVMQGIYIALLQIA
jgi:hypothetical protein